MRFNKEELYNRITGEEDARVCKDIPDSACNDQPHNFFAYLWANLLGKIADEISSAKLVLPWLFGLLGVPTAFTGFVVPIREAGVLLPQLVVAAVIRNLKIRKFVWVVGAVLSALSLFGMAWATISFDGKNAGWIFILMLVIFSLSRGICSVSAKDVLGKTVSKSRRGALMGWSTSLSGIAILIVGLWMSSLDLGDSSIKVFTGLLIAGAVLWLTAAVVFYRIEEQPGATEGGGNTLQIASQQLHLLVDDAQFRRFVLARSLLLSTALAPPFYVLVAQQNTEAGLMGLGALIIANGVASSISAPIWGYMSDTSSKRVMAIAAIGSGVLALFTCTAIWLKWDWIINPIGFALIFLLLNVMHGGVRLGRKVYLMDMATGENRAAYVAVSNTIIGVMMLAGGFIGLIGDKFGAVITLLLLGLLSLLAAFYIMTLKDVSDSD